MSRVDTLNHIPAAGFALKDRIDKICLTRLIGRSFAAPLADLVNSSFYCWPDYATVKSNNMQANFSSIEHYFDIGRDGLIIVILPEPPTTSDSANTIASFQTSSRILVDGMAYATANGSRLIVISEAALFRGDGQGFLVPKAQLRELALDVHRRLIDGRVSLEFSGKRLPISQIKWEAETTDPELDQIIQLPGGEVFGHFSCAWNTILPVKDFDDKGWCKRSLVIKDGTITCFYDIERRLASRLIGRRIVEIGIGLNPMLVKEPCAWTEKAYGEIHAGVGHRMECDLGPSDVHSDFLIDGSLYCNGVSVL